MYRKTPSLMSCGAHCFLATAQLHVPLAVAGFETAKCSVLFFLSCIKMAVSNFVLVMDNVQWDPTIRGLNHMLWQPYEQTLHFQMWYSWHAIIQWIVVWWDQSNVHWKSKHINSKSQQWIWIIPATTIWRILYNRLRFRPYKLQIL
jgi:hypothetical protein